MASAQKSPRIRLLSSPSAVIGLPTTVADTPNIPSSHQRKRSKRSSHVTPPPSLLDTSAPAAGGLVYGAAGGPSAWWTPIKPSATREKQILESRQGESNSNGENSNSNVELVSMSNRPRLRKVDEEGNLVWPFELEAVLIAGLRKYHATSARPRPSASRNFNRNRLVSEYIERVTGQKRSTKQIASRIQVLREAWKGTKQYTLVAQPKELAEMGYLPSQDDLLIPNEPKMERASRASTPGPIRNTRATRRSARNVKKDHETGDVELADADPEVVEEAFARLADDEGPSFPAGAKVQAPPTLNTFPAWKYGIPLSPALPIPEEHFAFSSSEDGRKGSIITTLMAKSKAAKQSAPLLVPPSITFNPFNVAELGIQVSVHDGLLPRSTLPLIQTTLRRSVGVNVLLARTHIPRRSAVDETTTPTLILEVDSRFIMKKIEAFQEHPLKRTEMGTSLQVLQNSVFYGARIRKIRVS